MKSQEPLGVLTAIEELCERYPHWRLASWSRNVAGWADQKSGMSRSQLLAAAACTYRS